jgi:hypothetical protein
MADKDSILSRRNRFLRQTFKEYYYPEELAELLKDAGRAALASDAAIGFIYDNDQNSGEFVREYLSGALEQQLHEEYHGLAPVSGSHEWSISRTITELSKGALDGVELLRTPERPVYLFDKNRPPIKEDLRNTIVTLYVQGLIEREFAERLFLLFELGASEASATQQRSARTQIRMDLRDRISMSTEFTNSRKPPHVSQALHVLNHMLEVEKNPDDTFSYRSMNDVQVIFARENPKLKRPQVNERVADYIAYGLEIIFKK